MAGRISEPIGRDEELAALGQLLAAREAPARILLLEGDAGIGKTTIWREGRREAARLGYRVLSCASDGAETPLAFTGLRDLLGGPFDDVAGALPPPQRHALELALLREELPGPPPEQGTVAVACLSTLRLLAARTPILLAVDDVHWLDAASAALLRYVLRRLGTEPVAVLLATRPGEHDPLQLGRLEPERVRMVELGSLTVGALGRILHERLGYTYPRPTLQRIHAVSGGNAFYALELAHALGASTKPLAPGMPLPVPGNLRQLVKDRLAALPARTFEVLVIASALSRPTVELIAAAFDADPAPLLDAAVDANVIEVDGDAVRFAHPLFAATVHRLAGVGVREVHARLADVVTDAEERARHLALATAERSDRVARIVEDGASAALARGSPATAAELAAHALRLTPLAEAVASERRALAEVDYRFAAGDTVTASSLLEELVAQMKAGPARARLMSRQARLHHFGRDIGGSVTLLDRALDEAGGDIALRGEIEEGLAWGLFLARKDIAAAADHARSAAALAEQRGDDAALAEGLAAQAAAEFVLGRAWRETMGRALSLEGAMLGLRVLRYPSFAFGYCLGCADELDAAREVFEDLLRRAEHDGDESSAPSILNHLTLIEALAGRWDAAIGHAEDGYIRALESGQHPTQASILAKTALIAARRGAADEARETAWQALAREGGRALDPAQPEEVLARGGETAVWTLGFLELSLGNPEGADRFLGPMTKALLAAGVQEPGEVRCLPDEIEALVQLGRFDEAEELLAPFEAWAQRLERASTLGAAGRCRGLLSAARGDRDGALVALEAAAGWHVITPLPFERARTLLALGLVQRRARRRRAARETLNGALAIFEELGAELWTEQTQAELGRIGGRTPSSGELTPTERGIAELVAEGKTNKEVAARLVVTDRTIESALTQIYRKLDVRSRTELARRLASAE